MKCVNILRKLDTIRKRKITFYGHLQRMDSNRLTGRIFKYIRKLKMINTWISETENDIEERQITHDITERTPLRNKLHNFKGFQEKPRRKTGAVWTEERREGLEGRMREIWRERKKEGRKQLKQT